MASGQFNALPTFSVPLSEEGITNRDWYRFWMGLFRGLAPENVAPISLTGSPYVYTAPRRGSVIISGGTVTAVEFSRDGGTTYYNTGAQGGMFSVNAADLLRITYAVAPTTTFVPT